MLSQKVLYVFASLFDHRFYFAILVQIKGLAQIKLWTLENKEIMHLFGVKYVYWSWIIDILHTCYFSEHAGYCGDPSFIGWITSSLIYPCEKFVSKKILGQGNGRDAVLIFVFVVYGFFFLGVVAKRAWACKSMDRRMRWNRDVSVNVF